MLKINGEIIVPETTINMKDIVPQLDNLIANNLKFNIILVDCPWYYNNTNSTNFFGTASYHYETIKDEKLKKLKIKDISEDDSILLMWCTAPKLPSAFDVAKEWNFKYITNLILWKKIRKNSTRTTTSIGFYTRGVVEYLLLFHNNNTHSARKFLRPQNQVINNLIETEIVSAEVREHSRKPDIIFYVLEKLFYNLKKIEIFSRVEDMDGNQLEKK